MSSTENQDKKDKGKAVQKVEDYQLQVPTKKSIPSIDKFSSSAIQIHCYLATTFFQPK